MRPKATAGHGPVRDLHSQDAQEEVEFLDDKAEGHDRDSGANPGEKGPLIGGVVAVVLDHRCLDVGRVKMLCGNVYIIGARPEARLWIPSTPPPMRKLRHVR